MNTNQSDERTHLITATGEDDAGGRSFKLRISKKCIALSTCSALSLGLLIILVALAVKNYTVCADTNSSHSNTKYIRTQSFSLLANVSDFTCYKPEFEVSLNNEGFTTIYQGACQDLKTKHFQISRNSLAYDNVSEPMIVLNEDFVDNYFVDGEIEVRVNTTFHLQSTIIYLCLFTDVRAFKDFTNYDKDWTKYTQKALACNNSTKQQFTTTFKITSPDYVFIAMASTHTLNTLQFSVNGTGKNFDQTQSETTEVCSLTSDKPSEASCRFDIKLNGERNDICILASTIAKADGSIDYFTVTFSYVSVKRYTNIGIGLTVSAILFMIIFVTLLFTMLISAFSTKIKCC